MKVLQSLLKTLIGCKRMKTLFEDIVSKKTKQFIFKVEQDSDGTYQVTQQALRVYPDGCTSVQSEKNGNMKLLLICAMVNSKRVVRENYSSMTNFGSVRRSD